MEPDMVVSICALFAIAGIDTWRMKILKVRVDYLEQQVQALRERLDCAPRRQHRESQ